MVRPLKKCKEDGTPYTRAPKVEALLKEISGADPATLLGRVALTDRKHAQYLPDEVLVYLLRHALRMRDDPTATALLPQLGRRCAQILKHKVRETNAFNATEVRQETLSRLYELFAEDLKKPDVGVLDYFEVRFNDAFRALRVEVIRKALRQNALLVCLDEQVSNDGESEIVVIESADPSSEADVEREALNAELHRLIQQLPLAERQAILRKYFDGLKTESTDPLEDTVATVCGVSGSEIRSRLRSAYARLKKRMEVKS